MPARKLSIGTVIAAPAAASNPRRGKSLDVLEKRVVRRNVVESRGAGCRADLQRVAEHYAREFHGEIASRQRSSERRGSPFKIPLALPDHPALREVHKGRRNGRGVHFARMTNEKGGAGDRTALNRIAATLEKLEKSDEAKPNEKVRFVVEILTLLALVVTIITAYRTANRANTIANDALRIGNRAYVVSHSGHICDKPGDTQCKAPTDFPPASEPTLRVDLVNSGNTPAFNLRIHIEPMFDAGFPPDGQAKVKAEEENAKGLSTNEVTKGPLGKEDFATPITKPGDFAPWPPSDADLQLLKQGDKHLVIYGVAWYADVFDEPHESEFCYYYNPKVPAMLQCPTHNSVR